MQMSSQPSAAVVTAAASASATVGAVAAPPPPPASASAPEPLRPASTASSPAQTNISLPTSATCSANRKRPREEEDTPGLASDTTATPSNTPPTLGVPVGAQGICAPALDAAGAAAGGACGGASSGTSIGTNRRNSGDGTDDEVNEAMAQDETGGSGESEEEMVLPDLPPREHLFRHTVDASEKLGCRAYSPDPHESLYWKIKEVDKGSQAETLGIKVGHYFISINGERLVVEASLTSAFQRAMAAGKPFEVVTSDFAVRKSATINNDSTGQQQQSGNAESGLQEGGHNTPPRTRTPDQGPSTSSERELAASPASASSERELAVSPAIRRAIMVQNSPASKSPYHTFDRVSKSIVPGPGVFKCSPTVAVPLEFEVLRGELRMLIKECTRRLCIFPQDGRPWLDYALNLVFSSLWYNAPDRALGWNLTVDEHRVRRLGIGAELKGPQLWMATRAFIVRCIKDMLDAEDNDWIRSSARKAALKRHHEYVLICFWCIHLLCGAEFCSLSVSPALGLIAFSCYLSNILGHVSSNISKLGTVIFRRLATLSCYRRTQIMFGMTSFSNTCRTTVVSVACTSSLSDGSFSQHVASLVAMELRFLIHHLLTQPFMIA